MKFKLMVAIVATITTSSVIAKDVSYSNFTIGWIQPTVDIGGSDVDLDGFGMGLSFDITNDWYLKLDASKQDEEGAGVDVELDLSTVNFGYHTAVSSNTDFIAEFGYAKYDAEANYAGISVSDDDSAANAVLGFRGMATDNFEWGVSVQHMDFDDALTFFNLEGRYFLTDNFSFGLKGEFESDSSIYALEARFDF